MREKLSWQFILEMEIKYRKSSRIEYYSAIKKRIMPFAAIWMDPEIITLSEACQKKKEKYHMLSLICGI